MMHFYPPTLREERGSTDGHFLLFLLFLFFLPTSNLEKEKWEEKEEYILLLQLLFLLLLLLLHSTNFPDYMDHGPVLTNALVIKLADTRIDPTIRQL